MYRGCLGKGGTGAPGIIGSRGEISYIRIGENKFPPWKPERTDEPVRRQQAGKQNEIRRICTREYI